MLLLEISLIMQACRMLRSGFSGMRLIWGIFVYLFHMQLPRTGTYRPTRSPAPENCGKR